MAADMAQLVEQRIRNAWVAGSSPAIGSFFHREPECIFLAPSIFSGGISSVGRALASQAEGRGFESRIPLMPLSLYGMFSTSFSVKNTHTFAYSNNNMYICIQIT